VLLGKRKNAHGEGDWCPPGGHIEWGETFEETARREVMEECGLAVGEVSFLHATNDYTPQDEEHYVTVIMRAEYIGGEAELCEPDKMTDWSWHAPQDFPEPLFLPIKNFLKDGKMSLNDPV